MALREMMRKALVFFPGDPVLEQSGAARHCMEQLRALREAGLSVVLASAALPEYTPWSLESVDRLRGELDVRALVHSGPEAIGLDGWFAELASLVRPDLIIVHYATFHEVMRAYRGGAARTVMDSHDVQAPYRARWLVLAPLLRWDTLSDAAIDRLLDEACVAAVHEAADHAELATYDQYDFTLAVSETDARLIRVGTRRTEVVVVPMTYRQTNGHSDFTGPALFTANLNVFNLHAYLYFVRRVLPLVQRRMPDFELHVTGSLCTGVPRVDGVRLRGVVSDLTAVYRHARFAVCPELARSGQKVKIADAMAHGLAVVATEPAAEGSPLKHGVNGLVAADAREFAEHVAALWSDPGLCGRLGRAARETIERERPRARAVELFSSMLTSRSSAESR